MPQEEIYDKIAHYICVQQEIGFELAHLTHLNNIRDDDVEELKLLCKKYMKTRNDIPVDVLEKLDSRRKDEI
jgi:hypothetical protein